MEGQTTETNKQQNNNNETQQQNQQQNNSTGTQQNNTQQQTQVDIEKTKSDAVAEYLKGLGVDDDSLKAIVEEHNKNEESKKTDIEKLQDVVTKTTKALSEEKELRLIAEAKLAAIKLGAKPELVDDLVAVAKSRVTKDKDIDAIVAEIKASPTGNVYFQAEGEQTEENKKKQKQKNLTRGTGSQNTGNEGNTNSNNQSDNKGTDFGDEMINRLASKRKKQVSHYFKQS